MLVNNFTLSYFLGLCPFFGVSAGCTPRSGWGWRRSS
jgi:Na+-translocating ferredoxin:NAD+ oxidoreductase RnfA subunit